ncbi:MAG TPA: hypothetical protein VLT33_48500, partial [Labilithrix sp.]|nr:hypothetical protein [Labilithrix sp.]
MASQEPVARVVDGVVAALLGLVPRDAAGLTLPARAEGSVSPAVLLRGLGVPEKLLPRAEDSLSFVVEVTGTAARPEVHATFQATELGFRFGRPRFHPAQIAGRLDLVIDVAADGAVRVAASLQLGAGSLGLEASLAREPAGARALTLSATEVEPSWIAAVTTALAGTTRLRVDDGSPVTLSPFTVPR